jgi:hypothetical protein
MKNIIEIKHFHPLGEKNCPNGSTYQKSGWYKECIDNENLFVKPTSDCSGSITFALSKNNVMISKRLEKLYNSYINSPFVKECGIDGVLSVGGFFKGKYITNNGEIFNDKSLSVGINGIDSKTLNILADMFTTEFKQKAVLVKDFNKNKIYLVLAKE